MVSLREALSLVTNILLIGLLFITFVLGLAVQTILQLCKERLPKVVAVGGEIRNWLRRPM